MTPSARISAAIEVLAEIEARRRPASDTLKDWGLSHRFAGSKDRAAIASLVYDALRRKLSSSFIMSQGTPRAIILGSLSLMRNLSLEAIKALCNGTRFAPSPLTGEEEQALTTTNLSQAPLYVQADVPAWLWPAFEERFGASALKQCQALATRAPLDIRVNTLKATRNQVLEALKHLNPQETPLSPLGIRFWPDAEGRGPSLQSEPEFQNGWFEIQDEGSQLVTLLCGAQQQMKIADICAGGGGKTLFLSAITDKTGHIYASDNDKRRLSAIHDRLKRAGADNVEVLTPRAPKENVWANKEEKMDFVIIDAPCTGTGTWRRNPDAKWRMREGSLQKRLQEQNDVLKIASKLVRPGGTLTYVTCSLLAVENCGQIESFLRQHTAFHSLPVQKMGGKQHGVSLPPHCVMEGTKIQLSPHLSGTDGFFLACLKKE